MSNVRLYTRQNEKTLAQLERNGRIINLRTYVAMHFGDVSKLYLESYDWFAREAAKRVPKPEDVQATIWCAISYAACRKPVPGTVVYVLDLPEEQVIYFDENKWDYVLNRLYLPRDPEDALVYQRHLQSIGVKTEYGAYDRFHAMYPEEEARIRQSWQRVFDIDQWSEFNVCGNIWEIRQEWVKTIWRPGESLAPEWR